MGVLATVCEFAGLILVGLHVDRHLCENAQAEPDHLLYIFKELVMLINPPATDTFGSILIVASNSFNLTHAL